MSHGASAFSNSQERIRWMWKSDTDPWSNDHPSEWHSYSAIENTIMMILVVIFMFRKLIPMLRVMVLTPLVDLMTLTLIVMAQILVLIIMVYFTQDIIWGILCSLLLIVCILLDYMTATESLFIQECENLQEIRDYKKIKIQNYKSLCDSLYFLFNDV